jgi:glycosyltransferase involved in cell wall biosynthesis
MQTHRPIKVYFPRHPEELHFVYEQAWKNPPEGINYVVDNGADAKSGFASTLDWIRRSLLSASSVPRKLYKRYWHWGDVSKVGVNTPQYDLYHSLSETRRRREPWIQECEHVGTLLGQGWRDKLGNQKTVQRVTNALADDQCKAIIPHLKAAAESLRLTLPDNHRFEDKLKHVHLAYDPPTESQVSDTESVHFLFVGSSHFSNQFYIKGGDKVFRAFDRIRNDINAHLTVRSDVPDKFVDRYGSMEEVDIITDLISRRRLEQLYRDSDVFVFPSAQGTPGAVFREAMGHSLPIIGLDIWGNSELVADGKTGFLVEPDEHFQYLYPEYNVPVVGTGRSIDGIVADLRHNDEALVERIANRMRLLAEDDDLRHRQARAGRERITDGVLSLRVRNEKLRQVYRDAVDRE